jgi:hypothetical protein
MRLVLITPIGFGPFPIRDKTTRLRAETFWGPDRTEWAGWEVEVEGPVVVFTKGQRRVEIPRTALALEWGPDKEEKAEPPPVVQIDCGDDDEHDEADAAELEPADAPKPAPKKPPKGRGRK